MNRILWLASYPKSGNTWLRAFLANYLSDARKPLHINALRDFAFGDMRAEYYATVSGRKADDLTGPEINALRPRVHRHIAASGPAPVFMKTHSALTAIDGIPTITPEATYGAIYVVRNPMDVTVSFAHHNGLDMHVAVLGLCKNSHFIPAAKGRIPQIITSWSDHVHGWTGAPGLHLKLIRFEDMLKSPKKTFGEVIEFLGMARDPARLKRAIRFSSFKVLAEQEKVTQFGEKSPEAERFFREGTTGGWRDVLAAEDVDMLLSNHRDMMVQYGYLTENGDITV